MTYCYDGAVVTNGQCSLDLPHQVGGLERDGMKRHQVDQFLDVVAAALAGLRCRGAVDPVHQLGHRDRLERDLDLPVSLEYGLDQLGNGKAFALGRDHDAGVEPYSQEGGLHGCW